MNKRFVGGMRAALFDSDLIASRLALAFAELCKTRGAWLFAGCNTALWVTAIVAMVVSVQRSQLPKEYST